jgi:hypothetical protein
MANSRSPNYPNFDLAGALRLAEKIYSEDGRNKVSRAALAAHLGHESLSGPALGKIGALRAYGLVEGGGGEELRISEDAIAALRAPEGSADRTAALLRLSMRPALFQAIKKDHSDRPSKPILIFWLIKQGFASSAARIAADSYLKTMALVDSLGGSYDGSLDDDSGSNKPLPPPPPPPPETGRQVKIMEGERVVFTEESDPQRYIKLVAAGDIDESLLDALTDYVKRQRKRLRLPPPSPHAFGEPLRPTILTQPVGEDQE